MKNLIVSTQLQGSAHGLFQPQTLKTAISLTRSSSAPPAPAEWRGLDCLSDLLLGMNMSYLACLLEPEVAFSFGIGGVEDYLKHLDINHNLPLRFAPLVPLSKRSSKGKTAPSQERLSKSLDKWLEFFLRAEPSHDSGPTLQLSSHPSLAKSLIEIIDDFEQGEQKTLLFSHGLELNPLLRLKLLCVYSVWFYARTLSVHSYNSSTRDLAFDCARVDRITNYLPHPEFTVNDSILLATLKSQLSGEAAKIDQVFQTWAHNSVKLLKCVPEGWFKELSPEELQNKIHQLQVHWLLGTPEGLLFRLREEAYGLTHGYQEIFHPEVATWTHSGSVTLQFQSMASPELMKKNSALAA